MKGLMFVCFMISFFGFAQSTQIYELEYNKNGTQMLGVGFDLSVCEESVIKSSWKDWVKGRNGKISVVKDIMGSSQASEVQFNRQSFSVFFDILKKDNTDSLTIVNIFQFPNGSFINKIQYPDLFYDLENTIVEFAYETKKDCVRNELEQANEYQGKLNDELVSLQRKKGREEKNILSTHNDILNWENHNRVLEENIATLQMQIADTTVSKRLDKLQKKKEKSEKNLIKNKGRITDAQNEIIEAESFIVDLNEAINEKNEQIELQYKLLTEIKLKLSNVIP